VITLSPVRGGDKVITESSLSQTEAMRGGDNFIPGYLLPNKACGYEDLMWFRSSWTNKDNCVKTTKHIMLLGNKYLGLN
jgi:hypothetical protein